MSKTRDRAQQSAVDSIMERLSRRDGSLENQIDDPDPHLIEAFARDVLAYHQCRVTLFEQLREMGLDLPDPDLMSAETLNRKLWTLILKMGELGFFLQTTDHLSDRELYYRLWHHILREKYPISKGETIAETTINMLDFCNEEDLLAFYLYFADEEVRNDWYEFFPEKIVPKVKKPPFDRDRFLPTSLVHV